MTALELKNFIRSTLIAQRTISQEYTALDAIVDFITQSITAAIPTWTSAITFNSDGSGSGAYCTYPDTAGTLRFWKSLTMANTNNLPPTNPIVTSNTFWQEVSPASGSAIKEWAAGIFGTGLIVVYYDLAPGGVPDPALYLLTVATRPFNSSNFSTELTAGSWRRMDNAHRGSWVNCGGWDASGGAFPTTGGTGLTGGIQNGNAFQISVEGTLGGVLCPVGTTILALTDTPGSTLANWKMIF